LGGFQEKSNFLIQKQTPAHSVVSHNWNFKGDWILWSDETKKKIFLAIQLDIYGCGPSSSFFFDGGPGHLLQIQGIMDYSKYQQLKKNI